MRTKTIKFLVLVVLAHGALAATHYVDLNSANPTPPYTNWATAATAIQDAVDAATAGDELIVTNGVYASGGRPAGTNALANRVVVDKPLALRSVNGPQSTLIQGYQVPGATNGDGAIRCVYLTDGASLSGFTLASGATRLMSSTPGPSTEGCEGGGVYCASPAAWVSNCVMKGNSADGDGGAAYGGTLSDCVLSFNSAQQGGGAFDCTLNNCELNDNQAYRDYLGGNGGGACSSTLCDSTVTGNSAVAFYYYDGGFVGGSGGGCHDCVLSNCVVSNNSALIGGGASLSTVNRCALAGNSAFSGGGAFESTLSRCMVSSNSAGIGGGASSCTVENCSLIGNLVTSGVDIEGIPFGDGGGADGCMLNNCTVACNSATFDPTNPFYQIPGIGGGAHGSTMINCIVYFNTADIEANYSDQDQFHTFKYCCTTPMPTNGVGNITNAPLFVDLNGGNLRLQSDSPCINGGNNSYVTNSTDLDGNPRIVGGTVDIGAYEFQSPTSLISYAWLQQYGLPTDGSADFSDPDGDGLNNWQEWRCGTDPTNPLSALRLLAPTVTGTNVVVRWQSVPGVIYSLQRSTNLGAPLVFRPLADGILGQISITTYSDTNVLGAGPFFYRVRVQ